MPNIVPVLILVDGEEIVKAVGHGGSLSDPKPLYNIQNKCIYMIANDAFVGNYNKTSELLLQVKPQDMIHWRVSAIGRDVYSPILVKYESNNEDALESPFQAIVRQPYFIQQNAHKPDGLVQQEVKLDVELMASVLEKDQIVTYHMVIKLVDHDGHTVGYYVWDPFIRTGE